MTFLEGPWNTFLVHPLMSLALVAYSLVHDFGLAIILVTVAIRLLVYPLYRTQIRSQRAMQELGPAMSELKKKYGKDKARFAEEQMKLYKEYGVNPAAGCLPLVLQLPILFALYSALLQLGCGIGNSGSTCPGLSHDDAQSLLGVLSAFIQNPVATGGTLDATAHWLPWITQGLQHPDPLFILPVLAGASQLIASVMAMPAKQVATTDPNQKMFQSMAYTFPLMTVVLGAQFPAGLTLYWIATTAFQIVQQYFVSGWGQLPKYLKFLRNIPTPADKAMNRETAAIVREGEADLGRPGTSSAVVSTAEVEVEDVAETARGQGRRRGRRRGKR
ncbi:MAG TPA: YidC/Oxa1 family membrane protein insertase [Candidatus Limnocylindrales bacterium]|nr:YidC/Oxa1 family membrane protein insertase [Candidatus Limnocylindrales bacterium]